MDNHGISYCLKYFINNQIRNRKKKNIVYFNTCYSELKINEKRKIEIEVVFGCIRKSVSTGAGYIREKSEGTPYLQL